MKKRKQFSLSQSRNSSKQPPQNMGQVYSMLNKQQEAIALLLRKYGQNDNPPATFNNNHAGLYDDYIKPRGQTIDTSASSNIKLKLLLSRDQKPETRQSSPTGRRTDLSISDQYKSLHEQRVNVRRGNQSVSLPIIEQKNKLRKSKGKPKNSYQIMAHFKRQRARMENKLYQIYGEKNKYYSDHISLKSSISNRAKPKKKKQKNSNSNRQEAPSRRTNEEEFRQIEQLQSNREKDQEKIEIESDDESEGQEIPTMYYERQFRDLMKGQCLEELNFLYFSKNEKMKDWTDTLLSMIEKHDKEVLAVRKKSKYMQSFDDKFFSIGIFNTDDV